MRPGVLATSRSAAAAQKAATRAARGAGAIVWPTRLARSGGVLGPAGGPDCLRGAGRAARAAAVAAEHCRAAGDGSAGAGGQRRSPANTPLPAAMADIVMEMGFGEEKEKVDFGPELEATLPAASADAQVRPPAARRRHAPLASAGKWRSARGRPGGRARERAAYGSPPFGAAWGEANRASGRVGAARAPWRVRIGAATMSSAPHARDPLAPQAGRLVEALDALLALEKRTRIVSSMLGSAPRGARSFSPLLSALLCFPGRARLVRPPASPLPVAPRPPGSPARCRANQPSLNRRRNARRQRALSRPRRQTMRSRAPAWPRPWSAPAGRPRTSTA